MDLVLGSGRNRDRTRIARASEDHGRPLHRVAPRDRPGDGRLCLARKRGQDRPEVQRAGELWRKGPGTGGEGP
jgi:hypothetical protein